MWSVWHKCLINVGSSYHYYKGTREHNTLEELRGVSYSRTTAVCQRWCVWQEEDRTRGNLQRKQKPEEQPCWRLPGPPPTHRQPLSKLEKCSLPASPELTYWTNWWDSPPYWYPHVGHNQLYCKQQSCMFKSLNFILKIIEIPWKIWRRIWGILSSSFKKLRH